MVDVAVQYFLPATIAMINLAMGLGLTGADFARVAREPRGALVGIVGQLVLLPLVGFAVASGLGLDSAAAVGLVLIAACPGGATSNLFTKLARGDVALSVTLTGVSGIATVFTIPLVVRAATSLYAGDGQVVQLGVAETMLKLGLMVLVPIALGMAVRARAAGAAHRLEPIVRRVAIAMLAVIIVGAVAGERERVAAFAGSVGPAVVLLNALALATGWLGARVLRLGRRVGVTLALEIGVQNGALAIGIALDMLGSREVAAPGVIYSLLVYGTSALVIVAARRVPPA